MNDLAGTYIEQISAVTGIASEQLNKHKEMLVAAYWAMTDIPPTEVELVQEFRKDSIVCFFRRRGERRTTEGNLYSCL